MNVLQAEKLRDLIAFCQNNDINIEFSSGGFNDGEDSLTLTGYIVIPRDSVKEAKP